MEDILQYIIIVLAIIVTIISKIRKQEKVNRSEGQVLTPAEDKKTGPLSGSWEKWFEAAEEVKPVKQEPVVVALHPQSLHADLAKKTKFAPDKNNVEKKEAQNNNEHSEYRPDIQLNSIEDVRRAIIYSEIIQRKY